MDGSRLEGIADAMRAVVAAGGDRPVAALSPGELLGVLEALGALKRHVDAGLAPVVAEVARQSRRELGGDSLARRAGFSSAQALVATTVGTSVGEAMRWVQVGEATAPRAALTGEELPAKHPHVARAVADGTLGMTGAAAITALLDHVAPRVDPERLVRAEEELVGLVPGLRPDQLANSSPARKRTWTRTASHPATRTASLTGRSPSRNATGCCTSRGNWMRRPGRR